MKETAKMAYCRTMQVIGEACVATALYAVATSLVRHAQDKIRKKREEKEED